MNEEILKLRNKAKEQGFPVLRDKSYEILLQKVKEKSPKKILEIGVNTGLSGISMLLEVENATLTGIEIDEEMIKIATENYKKFNVFNRAKIFCGDASEIIPLLTGKYDFIFLDGPKGHYFEYLPNLLSVLNVNGILFSDNVLFHGLVKGNCPHKHLTIKHSMEKFIDYITSDKKLKTEILEIEDGISITEKLYE